MLVCGRQIHSSTNTQNSFPPPRRELCGLYCNSSKKKLKKMARPPTLPTLRPSAHIDYLEQEQEQEQEQERKKAEH